MAKPEVDRSNVISVFDLNCYVMPCLTARVDSTTGDAPRLAMQDTAPHRHQSAQGIADE